MPLLGSIIKGAIELRSKLPTENRNIEPRLAQEKVLRKLLRKAQYTHFGEYYHFEEMLRGDKNIVDAFKEQVPVFDYNRIFQKWWYRSVNGEPYVCWPNKSKYFALSSGTSESSSKYIPVTNDMLKAIKKTSIRQLLTLVDYDFPREFYEKGILMLGGSTHLQYNGSYYEGDLSGINLDKLPFWFQHFYKPGKRISKERDWNTKLNEIVLKAKDWDIGVIVGVPAWLQILMEKIVAHYQVDTIHDIWPNLSIYVHGGVTFGPYAKSFEKLLARPLTYMETYLASEGFIAYQRRPHVNSMQLVLDNSLFMEFVEFKDANFDSEGNIRPNVKTYLIDEVEEGREYALLISSVSGAWRYLIGDTLKFTSKELCEIVITGRTKHYLSLCGEHLSQENMNRAIEMMEEDLNVDVREFTVGGVKHGSMFAHKWYIGTDSDLDPEKVRDRIDAHLKVLNDDYRVERIEAIKDVMVEILPAKVFYDFMRKRGKEGGQNKFPRVVKNAIQQEWEEFIKAYK